MFAPTDSEPCAAKPIDEMQAIGKRPECTAPESFTSVLHVGVGIEPA